MLLCTCNSDDSSFRGQIQIQTFKYRKKTRQKTHYGKGVAPDLQHIYLESTEALQKHYKQLILKPAVINPKAITITMAALGTPDPLVLMLCIMLQGWAMYTTVQKFRVSKISFFERK